MNELSASELKKPLDQSNLGGDVASLNGLLGMINNPAITGAEVPKGVDVTAKSPSRAITPTEQPQPPAAPADVVKEVTDKIFFTGRLMSGKDHCAQAASCVVHGFAEPIYAVLAYAFKMPFDSRVGKEIPGARAMQQKVGQWGRGTLDAEHPLTTERALFCEWIRLNGDVIFSPALQVTWAEYGLNANLWVDSTIRRLNSDASGKRLAVTNVRFLNEYKALQAAGYQPWHVMCSPQTWAKRLASKKLNNTSPEVMNISERLAANLDKNVIEQISRQSKGPKLHAIWNDDEVPSPSPRLHSVSSFLQSLALHE